MKGGFSIGSFNLKNFNAVAKRRPEFKEQKSKNIAQMIRERGFSVVALQEVQRDATVANILKELAGVDFHLREDGCMVAGDYAAVHCSSIYAQIYDDYAFKADSQKRGELAYIWNTRCIDFDTKHESVKNIYKGIEDSISRAIDKIIATIVTIVVGAILAKRFSKEKSERDSVQDLVAASGSVYAGVKLDELSRPAIEAYVNSLVRSTIRPPLVAVFTLKDMGDECRQLRMINVHSQFAKTKLDKVCESKLRQLEAEFLTRRIFSIVRDQRGGDNEPSDTIMLGDFNVSLEELVIAKGAAQVEVVQSELSTVKIANPEEYENGEDPVPAPVSNYDHFVFESGKGIWREDSAPGVVAPTTNWFLAYDPEKQKKEFISDHLPIGIYNAHF